MKQQPFSIQNEKFGLAVGRCAERDVHDGVELVVDAANELDAVDRAVTADYGVEDDFAFDMLVDQRRRILRIDLSKRTGSGDFRGTGARAFGAGAQFGKIENPASGGAVQ